MTDSAAEILVVGAGAAGLATAIFARRANRARSVTLVEGARKPGAKILVSGGSRCNVTNRVVSETDFWGGRRPLTRRVLRAFTADDAVRFFRDLNVPLHEEAGGKLFPDSNRSRDVLDALLRTVDAEGARLIAGCRVVDVEPAAGGGFRATTREGAIECRQVVLATGGQALPKSGSDGAGFGIARRLGHSIVETTPALAPLALDAGANDGMHRTLSGVAHDVELSVWVDGRVATRLRGAMLWTHAGVSGPVAMNASRHWLRATLEGRRVSLTANFCPGESFESLDAQWAADQSSASTSLRTRRPKSTTSSALGAVLPASVAAAVLDRLKLDPSVELAHLTREDRRALVHALVEWPLPVTGSRGYTYAEATAGGVPLEEVNLSTMESRVCPGLYLVGEILDVDGRIGGFNFQWAWSTAFVAGQDLGKLVSS